MAKIIIVTGPSGRLSRASQWAKVAAEMRGDTVEVKTVEQVETKRPFLVVVCDELRST